MIERILRNISAKLDDIEYTGKSCHVPEYAVYGIEVDLIACSDLLFEKNIPRSYPTGDGEKVGLRSVKFAANAVYRGKKIRIGTTEFHIAEQNTQKNVNAVIMLYLGEANEGINYHNVKGYGATEMGGTTITENGAVSIKYLSADTTKHSFVKSYFPKESIDGNKNPYPKYSGQITDHIKLDLIHRGFPKSSILHLIRNKTFKALPDLAMLFVDAYKELK